MTGSQLQQAAGLMEHTFTVKVSTTEGETVCIIGSCGELGNWIVKKAVCMKKVSSDLDGELWSLTVSLPNLPHVDYRYFVCVVVELYADDAENEIVVRRWETHLHPRRLFLRQNFSNPVEQFGFIGTRHEVESGWLCTETVVQLKLFNNPIQIWKRRFAKKLIYIKVTPVDLEKTCSRSMSIDEESTEDILDMQDKPAPCWPLIEIAVMNADECNYKLQEQFGRVYYQDDFFVYRAQMLHPMTIAYMVDFYLYEPAAQRSDAPPDHVGFCYILPSVLQNTSGTSLLPITGSKHQPIGQLTVDYVVVKPMQGYDCDMKDTYARYWRRGRPSLDVGHRGAGNSFTISPKHCPTVQENTIASLNLAADHGADYVEFDVQLSKDMVPIIYHDFHACITMKRKTHSTEHDLLEIPVKDLTVHQLQRLKIYHVSKKVAGNEVVNIDLDEDHHDDPEPFPTLQHALEVVAKHVGFNIEIKWTMQRKDGSFELENPMEMNKYVDTVIKILLQYAAERRIIISCFHPDICSMLRLKQNKYPVLFLTQGETLKWPPYHDTRTRSVLMAFYFARSEGILGIDVHTEEILKDYSLVKMCKDSGVVIFCWGDDNNDPNVINLLRQLGLDGIIYDRINEYKSSVENIFMMESKQQRNAIMESMGIPNTCSHESCSINGSGIMQYGLSPGTTPP